MATVSSAKVVKDVPHPVQLVGVGNDGHDEGVFEVHGHTDVYALSEDYAVPVPDRVEDRILFETLDDRLYYERHVGELYVFAFCEGGLLTLRIDVDVDVRAQRIGDAPERHHCVGIELGIESGFAPSRILLLIGLVLVAVGPLRAAVLSTEPGFARLPAII